MRSKNSPSRYEKRDSNIPVATRNLNEIKAYDVPRLCEGKEWVIKFNAFDPETGKMKLKRMKVNRIKSKTERRKYAKELIKRLSAALASGWNPFISEGKDTYTLFEDAKENYCDYLKKMLNSNLIREETYAGYISKVGNLWKYIQEEEPITYLYQMNKRFLGRFLNHIFIGRDNSAQTHNNYLQALKHFCAYLLRKGLMENDPTAGIEPISKRLMKKERTIIPTDKLGEISAWLLEHDKRMLLASYILYYCFIRPVEMTRLKIKHFHLKDGLIILPADITKNKEESSVTLPKKIIELMLDLEIFKHSGSEYLFSEGLMPGRTQIDTVTFRHHWDKVRSALNLPKSYQFYSLKDSGITEMLQKNVACIDVRDQARHSSLSITNIYASNVRPANEELRNYDGSF